MEAIPLGTRFVVGLFQAIAVRSAGFSAVNMAALASGVKFVFSLKICGNTLIGASQGPLRCHDVYQCL